MFIARSLPTHFFPLLEGLGKMRSISPKPRAQVHSLSPQPKNVRRRAINMAPLCGREILELLGLISQASRKFTVFPDPHF